MCLVPPECPLEDHELVKDIIARWPSKHPPKLVLKDFASKNILWSVNPPVRTRYIFSCWYCYCYIFVSDFKGGHQSFCQGRQSPKSSVWSPLLYQAWSLQKDEVEAEQTSSEGCGHLQHWRVQKGCQTWTVSITGPSPLYTDYYKHQR